MRILVRKCDDILENIKQRQETFDKEVSTLNDSENSLKRQVTY